MKNLCKFKIKNYLCLTIKQQGIMTTDRQGNFIGDGSSHVEITIYDLADYGVTSEVSESQCSESVYVTYSCAETHKCVTVRFSHHENNAVRFGDQLNGLLTSKDEVLYRLGLKKAVFVPQTFLYIGTQQVAKKRMHLYEETSMTIQEMYALGEGADLSEHVGKLAKGSNYLILGDTVMKCERRKRDAFGREVVIGDYIYVD